MQLVSAKLTGSPGKGKWSQIVEYVPGDKEDSRGHFFALASCEVADDSGSEATYGRKILSDLQSSYFQKSGSAFEDLKTSLSEFTDNAESMRLQVVALVSVGDIVYFSAFGGPSVSIFRDGVYKRILESSGTKVMAGSGHIKEEDLVLLSTSGFFEGCEEGEIQKALSQATPEEVVESFAPRIHSNSEQGEKALVVIRFGQPEKLEVAAEQVVKSEGSEEQVKPNPNIFAKRAGIFKNRFGARIYVKRDWGEDSKRRKNAVSVGAVLLVLLLISIGFGTYEVGRERAQKEYRSKVSEAQHNLDEARALFALNPVQARDLFGKSETIITDLEKNYSQNQEVKDLAMSLEDARRSVLGEFDSSFDEFVDLSLIDGFEAAKMAATSNAIYVYDGAKRRVAEVFIATKKTQVKAGPSQINEASALAAYSGRVFVVEGDGVYEVGTAREKLMDKSWEGDVLVSAYADNMYILDKSASAIYRYVGLTSGGHSSSWLAPGISIDLSKVNAWTIDGSIWILTSSGKVEKYSHGVPQDFELAKVDPALSNPTSIYTNEDLENIYVLDPNSSRVVVFGKDGAYKAQYKSGTLKDAIGVAASEEEGKIIVLTKEKLYSIPISS